MCEREARRSESQRRQDSLEIPKSLPKCDHCIFYRARGIANGFFDPPHIESLRAFYRPVAAGVTPADLDFLSFFCHATCTSARPKILQCSLVIYFLTDANNFQKERFSEFQQKFSLSVVRIVIN